jgi:hypothetical protein
VEQFCAENPQPEDQLGVDRLEDICKYKVICALRYKAEAKGGRITRLFGKSYIRWTKMWKVFRKDTEKLLRENTHIPKEEIDMFLQTYEASLLDGKFLHRFLAARQSLLTCSCSALFATSQITIPGAGQTRRPPSPHKT